MTRFRELAEALAFSAIRSSAFAVVASASTAVSRLRSTAKQLGPVTKGSLGGNRPALDVEMSRISTERRPLFRRIWRRIRSSSAGGTNPSLSGRVAGLMRASAFRTAPFSATAEAPRPVGRPAGPNLVEGSSTFSASSSRTWDASLWSLPYANARFWSGPEPFRLCRSTDRGGAARAGRRRSTSTAVPTNATSSLTWTPPAGARRRGRARCRQGSAAGAACAPAAVSWARVLRHALRSSARRASDAVRDQPAPVDPRDVGFRVTAATFPVSIDVVALEASVPRSPLTVTCSLYAG